MVQLLFGNYLNFTNKQSTSVDKDPNSDISSFQNSEVSIFIVKEFKGGGGG